MRAQAERFGAEIVTDDVTAVDLTGEVKTVTDGEGTVHRARSVILAMGSAYRELGLPREKELSGHGVSWCATCDGFFFRDQDIAVVGGGDSAIEEATFLTKFARTVTIIHRRDELRASKIMADRAFANDKIRFAWNSEVAEIHGEGKLSGVTLRDTVTGETRELAVTGLFVAIGHDPRNELVTGVRSTSTTRATCSSTAAPRAPTCPASSPAATSSTTPTARPSRPPAPAAPPPSTPSTTSPPSRTPRRPPRPLPRPPSSTRRTRARSPTRAPPSAPTPSLDPDATEPRPSPASPRRTPEKESPWH